MKAADKSAAATADMFGTPAKRGRPCSGKALSAADRQRKYRETHRAIETGPKIGETIRELAKEFDLTEGQVTRRLLGFALCNRNWRQTGF